ncbi:dihydropteroate synthase [Rhodoblastus sp.]|uniref:dihydropteroate synthase n=1 Tax=Rhodoblastus sp. TaxID=1962975 RepID=UPI003F9EABE8
MDRFGRARAAADAFLAKIGTKPLVMGILNVTPDSFSDGGKFVLPESALAQARAMAQAGADVIDLGAESTRPGFTPISEEEEWARLEPVLAPLLEETALPLSIDTTKAAVARRAAVLGAAVVNDVSGLRGDPAMAELVAESGAAVVVMHHREKIDSTIDIVADMIAFFENSLALAQKAGVERRKILLDPGVGFGKTLAQNLGALAATGLLREKFALPVLIGVSRKSFLGALTGAPAEGRLAATLSANLAAFSRGADVFRVHDVAEHVAALKVWSEIDRA